MRRREPRSAACEAVLEVVDVIVSIDVRREESEMDGRGDAIDISFSLFPCTGDRVIDEYVRQLYGRS